jgi:hypothetical protein
MFLCADVPRDDSSNGDDSHSDTTLHDAKSDSGRRDSLTTPLDDSEEVIIPALFSFQLIAGCSTAERIMCQYSRTVAAQEVQTKGGSQGTLTWRWESGWKSVRPTTRRRSRGTGP